MNVKRLLIHRLAKAHMAGPHLEDALRVCKQLAACGWTSILAPWPFPGEDPAAVASNYHAALNAIREDRLESALSIKIPALAYDLDLVRSLMGHAHASGTLVQWDAQDPDSAARSFALLEQAVLRYRAVGYTLPARWRRSRRDAERLIEFGIPVRVVKGQWNDPVRPVYDVRTHFLELIDVLAGRAAHVSVATHDPTLARAALMKLQRAGTPCQLEQILGLPIDAADLTKSLGIPLRLYLPYGYPSLPYNLFQIGRRPRILPWILKNLVRGTLVNPFPEYPAGEPGMSSREEGQRPGSGIPQKEKAPLHR